MAVKRYICIILMVAVSAASRFLRYFVSLFLTGREELVLLIGEGGVWPWDMSGCNSL